MKNIFLAALALVALASCSKTESVEISNVWSGELRISSGIETRATETTWEADDTIGVFMSNTGTTDAVGLHNTKYSTSSTATSATFTVDADFDELYYPQSGDVDIVAHYPYNSSATLSTYPIDVEAQSDLTTIDFMSAKMVGVAKSKTALALKFYHLLSQLKVTLTPATDGGLTVSDLAAATITVSGTQTSATATLGYDSTEEMPTATFSLSGNTVDLSLAATNSIATFIVVPQTTSLTFTITVAEVGEFYVTINNTKLTPGDEHSYAISVSRTTATIEGATINPWGSGSSESLDASDYIIN